MEVVSGKGCCACPDALSRAVTTRVLPRRPELLNSQVNLNPLHGYITLDARCVYLDRIIRIEDLSLLVQRLLLNHCEDVLLHPTDIQCLSSDTHLDTHTVGTSNHSAPFLQTIFDLGSWMHGQKQRHGLRRLPEWNTLQLAVLRRIRPTFFSTLL